jgi:hypothetical protein
MKEIIVLKESRRTEDQEVIVIIGVGRMCRKKVSSNWSVAGDEIQEEQRDQQNTTRHVFSIPSRYQKA